MGVTLRLLSKNICGSCTSRSKRFTITVSHSNNESISCKNGWTKHLAGIFIKKAQTSLDKIELRTYLRYDLGLTIQQAPPGLASRLRPNEDLLGR